jgi:dipeptide/tripeptide permease
MNPTNFLDSVMVNTVLNPIFIVVLSPLFGNYIYPCIEHSFPKKFGLLTRMVSGMILTGISFILCAVFQARVSSRCILTTFESNGVKETVCYDESFSTAWFIIPYFIITTGEVLFSISGLNFTYTEVGKRMKSSCAALWLLTVAVGNLLATVLFAATEDWDRTTYFYLVAGLCFGAAVLQLILNKYYVYKADRKEDY